jgi:ABC-type amino acid transport substrate-binding protein
VIRHEIALNNFSLQKYDMALAPLTISQSRASVIDFSKPYMDLGLGILMKIPSKPEVNIFGFVDPLSREVWFTSFTIMVVIALISLLFDKVGIHI